MDVFNVSNSWTEVKVDDPAHLYRIKSFLAYNVKNFQTGRIYPRSFLTPKHNKLGMFMTGLLPSVLTHIKKHTDSKAITVNDNRIDPVSDSKAILRLADKTLFDYQGEAVKAFLKAKRGVLRLPTGSGKTLTSIAIFKSLNIPTLWITHRTNLMHQTGDAFIEAIPELRQRMGYIGEGEYNPAFLTIATTQSIHAALKSRPAQTKQLLNKFKLLVIDEAHRMKAKSFFETALLCQQAYYRLALTATPFMRSDASENMTLVGTTGNIFYEVTPKYLMDRGLLSQPLFKFITVNSEPVMAKSRDWNAIYNLGIVENRIRNKLIASAAQQLCKLNRKPLIITQRLNHISLIKQQTDELGLNFIVVSGKDCSETRTTIINYLRNGKIDGIICSSIFDEGLDAKEINAVVLAGGGKSAPLLYQRVGRSTRARAEGDSSIIIDFIDIQHPTLRHHSMMRYDIVKNQEGYKIL